MPNNKVTGGIAIDDILKMYSRARSNYIYFDEEGVDAKSRKFEAFLMLAVLLERIITLLGLISLEKENDISELRESDKRKIKKYKIDNAIDDLYFLRKISTDEYKKLKKFQGDRNECFHRIFEKKNEEDTEIYASELFEEHEEIFKVIIEKLKEEQENTSK